MVRLRIALVAATGSFFLACGAVGAGDSPKAQDALTLAEQGKIAIEAVAKNAYSLQVRVKNLTPDELNVSFPPGLVADTYARFALFQVGGGGGMQSGGGGQSTGLMLAMQAPVNGNQAMVLNFNTVCLNFGAPEPTPKTVMMLKRVEDFTTDVVVQSLLRDLAANPSEEAVSQIALWHLVDKLDWEKLARIRTRRGRIAPEDVEAAKLRVDGARSAAASALHNSASKSSKPKLTALSLLVHPDPRGRHQDAEFARQAAQKLRGRWPGIDVSHRNFTPAPENGDADAVAWCFLVRSIGSAKAPDVQLAMQRNVWNAETKKWKHDALGQPITRTPPKENAGEWLADLIVEQVAAKSIVVEKAAENRLLVRNQSPIDIHDVFVTTSSPRERALRLLGLSLAPGESKEATLPLDHQPRFAAAKKVTGVGFTPLTKEKTQPGG